MPYAPEHIEAQQDGLLAEVGTFEAAGEYRFYDGDPTDGGAELAEENGYTHTTISAVTWAAASGEPAIEAEFSWTATAPWTTAAEYLGVHDADGALRFYEELPRSVRAAAAGAFTATARLTYAYDIEDE